MAWKDDLGKKAQEHIVLGLFGLITLLLLVIYRAIPSSAWDTVSEVIPKRVLWALIALEAIAIGLQAAFAIDNRRTRKNTPQAPPPLRMFGLLWDKEQNPLCPADQTPLSFLISPTPAFDLLKCAQCDSQFSIHHDLTGNMTLAHAKQQIRNGIRGGIIKPQ
jgi:hypothetical protein